MKQFDEKTKRKRREVRKSCRKENERATERERGRKRLGSVTTSMISGKFWNLD